MRPRQFSILAAALTVVFAAGCNRADETADTNYNKEPATTASQTPADTSAPAQTTAGTNTSATDTTGTAGTSGIEPTTPAPTPPATMADATTPFDDMDTNHDGSITHDELPDSSPLHQSFSTADKDGNGSLSRAEVDAVRKTMPPPGG